MVWSCGADLKREKTYENSTHKYGGKMSKRETPKQMDRVIRKDVEIRGEY